jgi:hypothetical protein
MENKEPQFAFGKKLGIAECLYNDIPFMQNMIGRLMVCMKETNKLHNVSCEFFRLDFRPQTYEEELLREFPLSVLILDLKWGSKKELEKNNHAL